MNTKVKILILLPLSFSLLSCNSKKEKEKIARPDLPQEVRPIAEAIENESPEQFAASVTYPIERPYPLHNVNDSAEMVSYYKEMVDAPLKKAVKEQPDSAWQQEGWRGWTLDNGAYFWIDAGKIYEVTYLSAKENRMLDSLQHEEISTLQVSLQKDWRPVACITDSISGTIFRIDTRDGTEPPVYRLAGYTAETDLSGEPSLILYGTLELEGSMGNRYYRFSDDNGTTAEYTPDVADEDEKPQIEIDRRGKAKKYMAKPSYWLDHIKKPRHPKESE